MHTKIVFLMLAPVIVIALFYLASVRNQVAITKSPSSASPSTSSIVSPQPTSTPTQKEQVKYPQDYTIVLVGDSMTERLGNSDEIRANLKKYYPDKTFEVLNYGFGSTNILSLPDRFKKETFHNRVFRPIVEIDYDLIIIESFGNNPLSEFPLQEGLKKHNETMDELLKIISESNPDAKVAFMATISPNKYTYAKGQVELSQEKRTEWVNERVSYIKNHINLSKQKNIPLINVFDKSLNKSGDGNLLYIDSTDNIHPSANGIILISQEIADTIHANKLFE